MILMLLFLLWGISPVKSRMLDIRLVVNAVSNDMDVLAVARSLAPGVSLASF